MLVQGRQDAQPHTRDAGGGRPESTSAQPFGFRSELRPRKGKGLAPAGREFIVGCFLEQRSQQTTPHLH